MKTARTTRTAIALSMVKGLSAHKLLLSRIANKYRNGNKQALLSLLDNVCNTASRDCIKRLAFFPKESHQWHDCQQEVACMLLECKDLKQGKELIPLSELTNKHLYQSLVYRAIRIIKNVYQIDGKKAHGLTKDSSGNVVFNTVGYGLFHGNDKSAEFDYMAQLRDESAQEQLDLIDINTIATSYSKALQKKLSNSTKKTLALYLQGDSARQILDKGLNLSRAIANMKKVCLVDGKTKFPIDTGVLRAIANK